MCNISQGRDRSRSNSTRLPTLDQSHPNRRRVEQAGPAALGRPDAAFEILGIFGAVGGVQFPGDQSLRRIIAEDGGDGGLSMGFLPSIGLCGRVLSDLKK